MEKYFDRRQENGCWCMYRKSAIDWFENSHKKWKLMYAHGMCHGGNQYINLIKDAFDVRNNVEYHHVSYIISYRIIASK